MLIDSIKMVDGEMENGTVETGIAFPSTVLSKRGRLFYLRQAVGEFKPGMYVFDGTIWASSSGGAAAATVSSIMSGPLYTPIVGNARWYPPANTTITKVEAWIGKSPAFGDLKIDIKKNGVSIFTPATLPTITVGQLKMVARVLAIAATTEDFFSIDVPQGDGSDLVVRMSFN